MSEMEYSVRAPLRLEVQGGETLVVREWSQSGLTYPHETDVLPKRGALTIPFQGVDIRFDVAFKKGEGPLDLKFKDLTGRQREVIGVFYRSILSGKMAASEDVITSLDTPVDLVPMGETEHEEAAGKSKQKPRLLRIVWNLLFYTLLALFLVGVIGGQIWDRLSSVGFENARIVAPTISHVTSAEGYVDKVLVEPGEAVRRGETLVRLSNPERDGDVDDIRRDISRAERQLEAAQGLVENHRVRGPVVRANLKITDPEALGDFDLGLSRIPGDFHDIRIQLDAQKTAGEDRLRRLKRDLGNAKAHARASDIVAQSDGMISEVLVFKDQYLGRGHEVMSLEENVARTVAAWLNEARSDAIFVGMNAEVTLRDGDGTKTYFGEISEITAGMDPITQSDFGMIVTVNLLELDLVQTRTLLRDGAPVKLRALKDWRLPSWLR
ncbi:MAG: HlyD family efflux transporter periplasmic adaptor subunit [Pseudomonadota bacterium]